MRATRTMAPADAQPDRSRYRCRLANFDDGGTFPSPASGSFSHQRCFQSTLGKDQLKGPGLSPPCGSVRKKDPWMIRND